MTFVTLPGTHATVEEALDWCEQKGLSIRGCGAGATA